VLRSLTLVFGPAAAGADCLCFTSEVSALVPHPAAGSGALLSRAPAAWALARGHAETCAVGRSTAWHITVDRLHWLSSAAVSLARGMNDAPKIVALALGAAALSQGDAMGGPGRLYLFVIVSMAAGSLLAGLRVTRMLAHDITPMDARQGLAANAVTAALVSTGALYGWPMSTTHVSTGGIVGMGRARGSVAWCQVGRIGLAWVVTLPAAAVLAATAFWVLEGAV
jgi:PiT family inorganic phosphate transporter